MNPLFYLCELGASFIEVWLCYHFVQLFFRGKMVGKHWFIFLSLLLLFTLEIAGRLHIFSFITTLWFVFYICMTTVVLFQMDVFSVVSLVSFYILCVYIIDFFSISVLGVLGKNQQFAQMIISHLSLWRCWYLIMNKLLLLFLFLLMKKAVKHDLQYSSKMLYTVSILGMAGVGFLSWLTIQETNLHTLFSWSLCIVMLFLFYYLVLFYSQYLKEKEDKTVLQLKDQLVSKEYDMILRLQNEQEERSHDLKNHLLVLSSMLQQERFGEVRAYIDWLNHPLERQCSSIWTGNLTLDVLLNHIRSRSDRNQISCIIQSDAISFQGMQDHDICCIFANLLDNALEAAQKVTLGERWICVKIRKANEMVFIEITNSMAGTPVCKDNRLVSAKRGQRLHGLGLKSAEKAVLLYGGTIEYHYSGGVFCARIDFIEGICKPKKS